MKNTTIKTTLSLRYQRAAARRDACTAERGRREALRQQFAEYRTPAERAELATILARSENANELLRLANL